MLQFVLRGAHRYTLEGFLGGRARHLADRIELVYYETLHERESLHPGTVVFLDHDRLGSGAREAAGRVHAHLREFPASVRVLNDPARAMTRFELLDRLHGEGLNDFRCHPADAAPETMRFPVHLRSVHGHNRLLTGLLADAGQLRAVLAAYRRRGIAARELMAVEFLDVADAHGTYAKFSAHRVGDLLLPRHADFSDRWLVKSSSPHGDDATAERHRRTMERFFAELPHRAWLERVFRIARIDYGRADFAVHAGRPQLWEINTNPVFGPRPDGSRIDPARRARLEPFKQVFFEPFLAELERLATPPGRGGAVALAPVREDLRQIAANSTGPRLPVMMRTADVARLAADYHDDGEVDRAEQLARKVVASGRPSGRAHFVLGSILAFDRGRPREGETHLARAVALEPEQAYWRQRLAEARALAAEQAG